MLLGGGEVLGERRLLLLDIKTLLLDFGLRLLDLLLLLV